MADNTKIEWCDATFNPWIGCTKVSDACTGCYAEALAKRYGWAKWGAGEDRKRTSAANWHKPIAWNNAARETGVRRRVFCASLADVFDAEVADDWRLDLMVLIDLTPCLEWLLLTKRPKLARQYFAGRKVPDNVRLGITAEDQKMLQLRAPDILAIEAKLLPFVSAEPLLGSLDFNDLHDGPENLNALTGLRENPFGAVVQRRNGRHFGQVISGGESGPQARPSNPLWFQSLRDQCKAAGVAYFHKQNGEWVEKSETGANTWQRVETRKGKIYGRLSRDREPLFDGALFETRYPFPVTSPVGYYPGPCMVRVGKKAAGATLDGREHREFPTG